MGRGNTKKQRQAASKARALAAMANVDEALRAPPTSDVPSDGRMSLRSVVDTMTSISKGHATREDIEEAVAGLVNSGAIEVDEDGNGFIPEKLLVDGEG